jgi:hypothetical protein
VLSNFSNASRPRPCCQRMASCPNGAFFGPGTWRVLDIFPKIQAITHMTVQIQHPVSLVSLTTTGTFIQCGRWLSISATLLLDPQFTIGSDIFFQPSLSNEFLVVTGVEKIFLDALGNIDLHVHISSCILITDSVPSKYLVQFIGGNPFVSNLSSENRAEEFRDLNFLLSAHIHCGSTLRSHTSSWDSNSGPKTSTSLLKLGSTVNASSAFSAISDVDTKGIRPSPVAEAV